MTLAFTGSDFHACLSKPARSIQSRLKMTSELRTASITKSLTNLIGVPACRGWSDGKAAAVRRLVNTRAPSLRPMRCDCSRLRPFGCPVRRAAGGALHCRAAWPLGATCPERDRRVPAPYTGRHPERATACRAFAPATRNRISQYSRCAWRRLRDHRRAQHRFRCRGQRRRLVVHLM